MKTAFALLSLSFLLVSCATTGKSILDVPSIKSQNIQTSALSGLPKRSLSIAVLDERVDKKNSDEMKKEVSRAVSEALTREGINVSPEGYSTLTLKIHNTEMGKHKEGCVRVSSQLTLPKKAKLGSDASSCFETRTPFGNKMSVDITKAYEEALSLAFKNLDQALGQLNQ